MGQKLPPDELKLYQTVDEILYDEWDPIGVRDVPEARDEYYAYLPQVFALLKDGNDPGTVAGYLSQIRVDRMGLPDDDASDLEVAGKLVALSAEILGNAT